MQIQGGAEPFRARVQPGETGRNRAPCLLFGASTFVVLLEPGERLPPIVRVVDDDGCPWREMVQRRRLVEQRLKETFELAALTPRYKFKLFANLFPFGRDTLQERARGLAGGTSAHRRRGNVGRLKPLNAPLGCELNAANALDLAAEELDTEGVLGPGGPDVDDAAAVGCRAGLVRKICDLVARLLQLRDESHGVERSTGLKVDATRLCLGARAMLGKGGPRSHQQRPPRPAQERERPGPLNPRLLVGAGQFIGQGLAFGQAHKRDAGQEQGHLFEQGLCPRRGRGQQQDRAVALCCKDGGHGSLGGLGHAKARRTAPARDERGHRASKRLGHSCQFACQCATPKRPPAFPGGPQLTVSENGLTVLWVTLAAARAPRRPHGRSATGRERAHRPRRPNPRWPRRGRRDGPARRRGRPPCPFSSP